MRHLAYMAAIAIVLLSHPALAKRPYNTGGPDGQASLTPYLSDYVNNYALAAATAETVTWPSGYQWANIACPSPFFASLSASISVPSADVTDGTGAALQAAQRRRGSETAFYLISSIAQVCSVEFWGAN
jgi:hypothetical protein